MKHTAKIDEIDIKILLELIKDARAKLKDIAKDCGITSAAICTRVKRLKAQGVITGSVLFSNLENVGSLHPASIWVYLNKGQEDLIDLVKNQVNTLFVSRGIGEEDLSLFVVVHDLQEMDNLKQIIKNQQLGIKRILLSYWKTPYFNFENIDLRPTRA